MKDEQVTLSLSAEVLSRLLRERALVASEFRCLTPQSREASRSAIKASLMK